MGAQYAARTSRCRTCFDQLEVWAVENSNVVAQRPGMGHRGIASEHMDHSAWPTAARASCDSPVVLGQGARQDAPGTPTMWNYATSAITRTLTGAWEDMPIVERCPALGRWPIFLCSDTVYSSPRTMLDAQGSPILHSKGNGGHRCVAPTPGLADLPLCSPAHDVAALVRRCGRGIPLWFRGAGHFPPMYGASAPSWRVGSLCHDPPTRHQEEDNGTNGDRP